LFNIGSTVRKVIGNFLKFYL